MARFHSYVNSASTILNLYKGEMPFHIFLRSYFSQHKKFGSKDRKQIGQLCYSYFRLGHALQELPIDERILSGYFLCEQQPTELLESIRPEWNELISLSSEEKAALLNFFLPDIFPWQEELSGEVEYKEFASSFLSQPDLYLRLRPGHEENVRQQLKAANIPFNPITSHCLSLNNPVQVDKIIELDKVALVQDYNSQRVGEFFPDSQRADLIRVYDCCAASGGKSILAYDLLKNIELTVSDIRESILINLKKRFERAGIKRYNAFVRNLSNAGNSSSVDQSQKYDLLIADAPCSGSGTWGRTPEQLYYFEKSKIDYYSNLQKNIVSNVIPLLKENGYLLYITCSVFKKENEEVINYLQSEFNLKVEKMELLSGYVKKADTLFAALLKR